MSMLSVLLGYIWWEMTAIHWLYHCMWATLNINNVFVSLSQCELCEKKITKCDRHRNTTHRSTRKRWIGWKWFHQIGIASKQKRDSSHNDTHIHNCVRNQNLQLLCVYSISFRTEHASRSPHTNLRCVIPWWISVESDLIYFMECSERTTSTSVLSISHLSHSVFFYIAFFFFFFRWRCRF